MLTKESTEELAKVLGTPSAQKIFQILVCWEKLTVKEIGTKARVSEAQTYKTLKILESQQIVTQLFRGYYGIANNNFAEKMKEAYLIHLKKIIGNQLYVLSKEIQKKTFEEMNPYYIDLIERWEPILHQYFSLQLSQLTKAFLKKV